MIQIYNADNTDYTKNGDKVLLPTSCKLNVVLKSDWTLTITHPFDDEGRWKYIKESAVVSIPSFNGTQLFRIIKKKKGRVNITATAYPIFFDSTHDHILQDVRPTIKNGQEAIDIMTEGSVYSGESDITAVSTAYYQYRNLMEAINGDIDQSFLNRWGGEPIYDNYHVIVNERAGGDYGVEALYGKNISSIEEEVDYTELATRLIPKSFNGHRLEGDEPWVDSPLINNFPIIYTKQVEFEKMKLAEDVEGDEEDDVEIYDTLAELQAAMIVKCEALFEDGADSPEVTLNVKMVPLSQTQEYQDYKVLETVSIGDTVRCVDSVLGVSTVARVTELVWDCILKRVDSLVIGDHKEKATNSIFSTEQKVSSAIRNDGSVVAERVAGILNAMDTQLKYQKDIAQRQDVRAILFEDLDESSTTYGAMCLGTQGFQIANKRTADGREWDWTTAATANGIIADAILTGLISDKTGNSWWNLDTGDMQMRGIFNQYDGVTGYPSVSISNNRINFYDWEDSGNYVGSVGAVQLSGSGRRGTELYCDNGDMLWLGWHTQDGSAAPIQNILSFDSNTPSATPWIRNTASGTLFPSAGGGIVVENGFIKSWSLNTTSGTIDVISGLSWSGGNITSITRTAITVANGLIVGTSTNTTNY